jgi:hypothetical protein
MRTEAQVYFETGRRYLEGDTTDLMDERGQAIGNPRPSI